MCAASSPGTGAASGPKARLYKKTAKLLFENDIKSAEDIEKLTFKDLIKIKGIKRKDVKMILKEVEVKG